MLHYIILNINVAVYGFSYKPCSVGPVVFISNITERSLYTENAQWSKDSGGLCGLVRDPCRWGSV